MTTDPRVKNLRDAQRRLRSTLIANADRLDKPFTDNPDKNPWDTFVRPTMRELKDAVDAIAAALAAVPLAERAGLRDRIRRAVCEAEGFAWDSDMLEPDEYGDVADMVLAVLPTDSEPHRLALSDALGLGTSAPWDAIRERAAELAAREPDDTDLTEADVDRMMVAGVPVQIVTGPPATFAAALPAPVDRGAALRDVADLIEARQDRLDAEERAEFTHLDHETVLQGEAVRGMAKMLRRLAAETQPSAPESGCAHCGGPHSWDDCEAYTVLVATGTPQPETQAAPRRGDAVEQWLKAQRDEYEVESSPQWGALDEVLDTYRLHADTGTPLGEHVCEGRAAGDCDCLETPTAETPDAPRREPHPTEADLRHALAVAAKFHGQAATAPAVVTEPGKER